jgi:hypothetical protein
MGKPRVNQFAEDLGISRSEAMNLIKAGRNRKDGGSTVLENNMSKMKGKIGNSVGPIPLPDEAKRIRLARAMDPKVRKQKEADQEAKATANMLAKEKEAGRMSGGLQRRGDDRPVIMAKDGVYNDMGNMCRGGGKAIRGTKFSGVK